MRINVDDVDKCRKSRIRINFDAWTRRSRPTGNSRINLPLLLVHRNFIWPLRQSNLLNKLECLRIEDINGMLTLIRAVVIQPIGVGREVMRIRTTSDETRNLISGWIDYMLNSSGIITLQDAYGDALV